MLAIDMLRMKKKPAAAVTVSNITPSSQGLGGTTAAQTFSPSSLNVTGGSSITYVWSFVGIAGGTWTVNAGQGTNTGTARVSSVADMSSGAATFRCTVTVDGVDYIRDTTLSYDRDSGGVVGATMTL